MTDSDSVASENQTAFSAVMLMLRHVRKSLEIQA